MFLFVQQQVGTTEPDAHVVETTYVFHDNDPVPQTRWIENPLGPFAEHSPFLFLKINP